jgi:hypothetical protein
MSADATAHALPRHAAEARPAQVPLGIKGMLGVFMAIGLATFLTEVRSDPAQAWAALLINHWVFLGFALAGTLFTAIHYLVGAIWSVAVRRVARPSRPTCRCPSSSSWCSASACRSWRPRASPRSTSGR